jgi:hypothetical protein
MMLICVTIVQLFPMTSKAFRMPTVATSAMYEHTGAQSSDPTLTCCYSYTYYFCIIEALASKT